MQPFSGHKIRKEVKRKYSDDCQNENVPNSSFFKCRDRDDFCLGDHFPNCLSVNHLKTKIINEIDVKREFIMQNANLSEVDREEIIEVSLN